MALVKRVRQRESSEVWVERGTAVLLLANAALLAAFPYFCPMALQTQLLQGQACYDACNLALARPLFPLSFLLAALDAALAVALWRGGARLRRWVLLRAVLGAIAWGFLALIAQGNLYAVAELFVAILLLFLLGAVTLRLILPSAFWLIVFFTIPLFIVFVYSFLKRGVYGGVEWTWHPENYVRFFDPLYLSIFGRSFYIAALTTVLCFLFGYPLAYFIARQPARWRNVLLLLLMLPFWTNFVVRTYAWKLILSDQGFLNSFWTGSLHSLVLWLKGLFGGLDGLVAVTGQPISLLYTDTAVIIGLVYGWITDMTLPCYAAIERLDFSLVEAAKDLYANDLRAFRRVVLPLSTPGIVAGCILVFIPSLGAYVTPDLLGGAKTMMIGNLIQQQFLTTRDWPFGSAISFVLMAIMLLGTLLYFRVGGKTA
jgi:spermidine/putrescine transport system permease protein